MEKGEMYYNYQIGTFPVEEAMGISVFYKNLKRNKQFESFHYGRKDCRPRG